MEIGDFFDLEQGPARDRYGRPLLIPRGGTEEERRWYTRASSLADMIEDFSFLHTWQMRYLVQGLARRMDLVRLAAAETYTTGFAKGDDKENRASGKRLDEIIGRALDSGLIHEKADYGTAVHARTEPGNTGSDPNVVDQDGNVVEGSNFQADEVQSFWDLITRLGIVIIGTELFTANDTVHTAGTFDHLMYIPGIGIVVTDKKTSSKAKESYDVQLAVYAHADIYDFETDKRISLEEYVASKGWDPALLRRDIGFLFWIKNGKTQIRHLDLKVGWESAKVAAHHVRDIHRKKGTAKDVTKTISNGVDELRSRLLIQINEAPTPDALLEIWNDQQNQAIWHDHHTEAAKARKEAL